MTKHHALLVQQPIDAKLDPGLDDPAQGAVVVVGDVADEEGIIRTAEGELGHVGRGWGDFEWLLEGENALE